MTILEEVRLALRLKTDSFDEGELLPLIEACKCDMAMRGVTVDEIDPLFRHAVKLYAKGEFGYGDEQEKFQRAYAALRDSMSLSGDYRGGGS